MTSRTCISTPSRLNHNAMGRGYETFGNGTAETLVQNSYPDETSREWYRPSPPPSGPFRWSARDNLNYTETAALAALDLAAQQSKSLLSNFYQKGVHSWRRGLEEAPFAFLIPNDQGDPQRVAQLVSRCSAQGIEVHRATADADAARGNLPRGHLRGAPRPAVSQLCRGPVERQVLSQGCRRAVRRYLLGTARATTI